MKKLRIMYFTIGLCLVGGCSSDSEVVTRNVKEEAEQFKVLRRIVFINNITGEYLFQAEGNCSVETNNTAQRLELTCKTGEDKYKVHYFGLSDNTSYIVEQTEWREENKYKYKIIFKPDSIVPFEFDKEWIKWLNGYLTYAAVPRCFGFKKNILISFWPVMKRLIYKRIMYQWLVHIGRKNIYREAIIYEWHKRAAKKGKDQYHCYFT